MYDTAKRTLQDCSNQFNSSNLVLTRLSLSAAPCGLHVQWLCQHKDLARDLLSDIQTLPRYTRRSRRTGARASERRRTAASGPGSPSPPAPRPRNSRPGASFDLRRRLSPRQRGNARWRGSAKAPTTLGCYDMVHSSICYFAYFLWKKLNFNFKVIRTNRPISTPNIPLTPCKIKQWYWPYRRRRRCLTRASPESRVR